jgi:hypothetical protein
MTFRQPPFARWFSAAVLVAIGGYALVFVVRTTITEGFDWFATPITTIVGLMSITVAVLLWGMFIEVTDSTVTLGTFLVRRAYPRSEIVKISAGAQRTMYFMLSDGRVAFSVAGFMWGDKTLAAVANYLGVPVAR